MKRCLTWVLVIAAVFLLVVVSCVVKTTREMGYRIVHHSLEERQPIVSTPAEYGLTYQDVTVTTADGLNLVGWYIPSSNGAAVMTLHGYKRDRQDLLVTAEILHRHNYGVLVPCTRAHDQCDGELLTLGKQEMQDLEAWYQFLLEQPDVDPNKIGILGESFGAMLSLQYAAQNPEIGAVVSHSGWVYLVEPHSRTSPCVICPPEYHLQRYLEPLIFFWVEREADARVTGIDARDWIAELSPRPVFVLMGGKDDHISLDSGEQLFAAAGEPKEYWFEPDAGHHGLEEPPYTEEFETKVVGFLDQYLLEE